MGKAKGSRAERELFHMFWEAKWHTVRSAGSGSTPLPNPDLIVGNAAEKRILAIECKSLKAGKKYFSTAEINQLKYFAEGFGAEPWIAIRFDTIGWFFLKTQELPKTKGESFAVSLGFAQKNGIKFEELIGLYIQKKLEKNEP
ncbi:hypothetical protein HY643_03220 [Candidatus Woesearchaeota archaeon]|nr:hypothetical protein [Candidatus Woesearchaeota archaeon]